MIAGCRFSLRLRGTAKDNSFWTKRFIQNHHHFKVSLSYGLFLEEFRFLLFRKGFQFHPATMKLQYIGMREKGQSFGFWEDAVESFLGVFAVKARFDFDYLGGIYPLVDQMSHPVNLREPAAANLPQILKLIFEALYR